MKTAKLFLAFAVCASMMLAGCSKKGSEEPKAYTITVESNGYGEAMSDKTTAMEGETVTLEAMPEPDCEFVKWTVVSGGVTCSPDASANPATFTMHAANVSIKAEFSKGVLINGVAWAPCNVDAPGTFAANPEDAGMYYQWNRRTGWSSSDPMTSSPAGATWDKTDAAGERWAAANDPCPAGWRVPTNDEQFTLCDEDKTTNEWTELSGVIGCRFTDKDSGNSIFLPALGSRFSSNSMLSKIGSNCFYWSAMASTDISAHLLQVKDSYISPNVTSGRAMGFSVRCVLE